MTVPRVPTSNGIRVIAILRLTGHTSMADALRYRAASRQAALNDHAMLTRLCRALGET